MGKSGEKIWPVPRHPSELSSPAGPDTPESPEDTTIETLRNVSRKSEYTFRRDLPLHAELHELVALTALVLIREICLLAAVGD